MHEVKIMMIISKAVPLMAHQELQLYHHRSMIKVPAYPLFKKKHVDHVKVTLHH